MRLLRKGLLRSGLLRKMRLLRKGLLRKKLLLQTVLPPSARHAQLSVLQGEMLQMRVLCSRLLRTSMRLRLWLRLWWCGSGQWHRDRSGQGPG